MNNTNTPDRVVREREREHITGMPKASWYALPEDERPKQIKLRQGDYRRKNPRQAGAFINTHFRTRKLRRTQI